jgi:hypothetical protein
MTRARLMTGSEVPHLLIKQHAMELIVTMTSDFQDRCLKPLGHPSIHDFATIDDGAHAPNKTSKLL